MTTTTTNKSSTPSYYLLDLSRLPDNLHKPNIPSQKWTSLSQHAGPDGFPPNTLNSITPIHPLTELERLAGIPFYMMLNYLPFVLPGVISYLYGWKGLLIFLTTMMLIVFTGIGQKQLSSQDQIRGQYLYTERNSQKYCSTRIIWPSSVSTLPKGEPAIFAAIPHGFAPMGVTCYTAYSKLWMETLCHWTCAPVVLKIPLVNWLLRTVGYIAAKKKDIMYSLVEKKESVGLVLDGIAGMFQSDPTIEKAWVLQRKGIVAIALKAGVPIIPVYVFGHTTLWSIIADPFGILERVSVALDIALCPFVGRWCIPLGPPQRVPVVVALGDPILCPQMDKPTPEIVDQYHQKLVDGYSNVFDTHKVAYGWGDRNLRFV